VFGSAAAPLDIWQFNVNTAQSPASEGFSDLQMDGLADGARTAYTANLNSIMPSHVVLTETRYAHVDGSGKVRTRADGSYLQGIKDTPSAGSVIGGIKYPLQTAIVVSLQTARPGATGKGRFYLPFPAWTLGATDHRVTTPDAGDLATKAAAFITQLNGIAEDVAVVSSYGYTSRVTGVRVGRVADTMRSRRSQGIEGYSIAPLV
jgi:hypothetical protein